MTIGMNELEVIRDHAIHMDWDVAFDGKSRGNQHLRRVNKIVVFLAGRQKARLDISVVGGWLHDIGLAKGNKRHCFTGVPLAREFLADLSVDQDDIERVVHCIEAHDGEIAAETPEARVVHDADTIDKMGPFGYIRHVWKTSLIENITPRELAQFVRRHVAERESNLYFEISRNLARKFNSVLNEFLADEVISERIVSIISEGASKGIPSERVADMVLRDSSPSIRFRESIKSQMVVDYLQ
jgi:HD superfamily phosphodiesterase